MTSHQEAPILLPLLKWQAWRLQRTGLCLFVWRCVLIEHWCARLQTDSAAIMQTYPHVQFMALRPILSPPTHSNVRGDQAHPTGHQLMRHVTHHIITIATDSSLPMATREAIRPILLGISPVAAVARDHSSKPASSTLRRLCDLDWLACACEVTTISSSRCHNERANTDKNAHRQSTAHSPLSAQHVRQEASRDLAGQVAPQHGGVHHTL